MSGILDHITNQNPNFLNFVFVQLRQGNEKPEIYRNVYDFNLLINPNIYSTMDNNKKYKKSNLS